MSEGFARVRGLQPGDELMALVNGKRRTLRIVCTALSPEYIFAGMPDMRGFGVFWVDREALAAAYDLEGAFNLETAVDRLVSLAKPHEIYR